MWERARPLGETGPVRRILFKTQSSAVNEQCDRNAHSCRYPSPKETRNVERKKFARSGWKPQGVAVQVREDAQEKEALS